jgi:hypothetical protein
MIVPMVQRISDSISIVNLIKTSGSDNGCSEMVSMSCFACDIRRKNITQRSKPVLSQNRKEKKKHTGKYAHDDL